jgi:hypothetical protein
MISVRGKFKCPETFEVVDEVKETTLTPHTLHDLVKSLLTDRVCEIARVSIRSHGETLLDRVRLPVIY